MGSGGQFGQVKIQQKCKGCSQDDLGHQNKSTLEPYSSIQQGNGWSSLKARNS